MIAAVPRLLAQWGMATGSVFAQAWPLRHANAAIDAKANRMKSPLILQTQGQTLVWPSKNSTPR
jgi:hypothetical protein